MICDCFSIVIYTDRPWALSSVRLDKFVHYKPLLSKYQMKSINTNGGPRFMFTFPQISFYTIELVLDPS